MDRPWHRPGAAGYALRRLPTLLHPPVRVHEDLIEWTAAQPWSAGAVGMLGVSYLAISQWKAAALQPPSLKAICPWEGFTDAYQKGPKGRCTLHWGPEHQARLLVPVIP